MKNFVISLLDATHSTEIEGVTSFIGEDQTGSFGLLANHSRFMTVLSTGIAKYRTGRVIGSIWQRLVGCSILKIIT